MRVGLNVDAWVTVGDYGCDGEWEMTRASSAINMMSAPSFALSAQAERSMRPPQL